MKKFLNIKKKFVNMKIINKIILFSIFLSIWSCITQTTSSVSSNKHFTVVDNLPHLGESFYEQKDENRYILIPYNHTVKHIEVVYDGIEYSLGVSNNQTIVFIGTSDKHFTVNGFKIGDKINKFDTIRGWGSYTKIDDEWYAAWLPTKKNEETGKIQFFFKYKFNMEDKTK